MSKYKAVVQLCKTDVTVTVHFSTSDEREKFMQGFKGHAENGVPGGYETDTFAIKYAEIACIYKKESEPVEETKSWWQRLKEWWNAS